MLIPLAVLASACQADRTAGNQPGAAAASSLETEANATSPAKGASMIATYRAERLQAGGVAASALARVDGTLAQSGGCLVIKGAGGGAVQPVFPEGKARWDPATGTLVLGGETYRLGSRIVVGGGGVGDEEAFAARAGVTIPRCGGASLFIVSL